MKKTVIASMMMSLSVAAQAQMPAVEAMQVGQTYFEYTAQPQPFEVWKTSSPVEYEFLNLYPGYEEPTLLTPKKKMPVTEKLTMFVAHAKTIINESVDVKSMATLDFAQKLDTALRHGNFDPSQTMTKVAGTPHQNFQKLCNSSDNMIARPSLELNLSVLERPGQPWCSDTSRSICVESCYLYSMGYQAFAAAYNLSAESEYDKKDFGFAVQSELRYFLNEAELGAKQPISNLTGVQGPVTGILEQNIFYWNQMVQYGKLLIVLQQVGNQTVVSSFLTFAVQTSTWSKVYNVLGVEIKLQDVMMDGMPDPSNAGEPGITAGLPAYSKVMAESLTKILAN